MDPLLFDQNGPNAFIIAMDGSFSANDPLPDHVWSFSFSDSETHPFLLETTYGLCARSMRLFPNIILNNTPLNKTTKYLEAPRITRYTPAHLCISCQLGSDVFIQLDFFVPENNALVGGFDIVNRSADPISLTLELAANLIPMNSGNPMLPQKVGINQILKGNSGDLWPVLFMTGGPMSITNPYPALSLPVQISPSETRRLTWSLVTTNDQSTSFESARRITAAPWREQAQEQFMKHDKRTVHIRTGVSDWDSAFYLTQMTAMSHLKTSDSTDVPRFIRVRLPDQARSDRFSSEAEDTLTLLELLHLSQVILPSHQKAFKSHFEAYLNQFVKPDHQHFETEQTLLNNKYRECPLLAQMCLEIYEIDQDRTFLQSHFPSLTQFFKSWTHYPDYPGKLPPLTWDNPGQLAVDTGMFLFDIWAPTGKGLNIQYAESPALAAMLLREAKALYKIAEILANEPQKHTFEQIINSLRTKTQTFWRDDQLTWSYQDYQSSLSPKREIYYPGPARENLEIHKQFTVPQRLQCHLYSGDKQTRVNFITFHGENSEGQDITERLKPSEIRWFDGRAHITTAHLYRVLHSISLKGMKQNDRILVETASFSQGDITCLAPVWAGEVRKGQWEALLDNELNWQDPELEYGIPETWQCLQPLPEDLPVRINTFWNSLIINGLVEGGHSEPAMHLFTNLMMTIVQGLKQYKGFFPFFDIDSGRPAGQRNAITGLIPLRLFLQIAGIRLITPNKVAVWGNSPFPWPVEISWQGLSIRREGSKTEIIFPDGTTYHAESEQPVILTSDISRL